MIGLAPFALVSLAIERVPLFHDLLAQLRVGQALGPRVEQHGAALALPLEHAPRRRSARVIDLLLFEGGVVALHDKIEDRQLGTTRPELEVSNAQDATAFRRWALLQLTCSAVRAKLSLQILNLNRAKSFWADQLPKF